MTRRQKKTALDRLLARVTVVETPDQQEAVVYVVQGRARNTTVHLDPARVSHQERHEVTLRGAALLILDGFSGYNATVRRAYGTFEKEQREYDRARAGALAEIEALLHQIHPYAPPEDQGAG
ncbi:hypothetical protein DAETH_48180 (plasmid) [Deinococcus aetherius]|uniref:Uncharacterized protein n=1 Tax=Deinococcus aetherius TaxID=200252 RepID=A0ABN6RRZ9_9DEIO|nr:hypothetical protein [Deinococcus aetherius]BDP44849.1 hypothetical protein DAETH_48180 [Deinococcus aetherius]